jgi:hypothetical protein
MNGLYPPARLLFILCALFSAVAPAMAGPPFLTDDPVPTDTGHWEIYGPLIDADGRGAQIAGNSGLEVNYGAAPGVQLTFALPIAFSHDDPLGWHAGRGDLELSAKYRFYHNDAGFSVAAFPGITLPTASSSLGNSKVTALLPIWAQQDIGPWSVFGGGGYAINPGPGNRDYWTGGLAVTRQISKRFLFGVEMTRDGADSVDSRARTNLGIGAIWNLKAPFRLLASGGPTLEDGGGKAGYHMFVALGLDF